MIHIQPSALLRRRWRLSCSLSNRSPLANQGCHAWPELLTCSAAATPRRHLLLRAPSQTWGWDAEEVLFAGACPFARAVLKFWTRASAQGTRLTGTSPRTRGINSALTHAGSKLPKNGFGWPPSGSGVAHMRPVIRPPHGNPATAPPRYRGELEGRVTPRTWTPAGGKGSRPSAWPCGPWQGCGRLQQRGRAGLLEWGCVSREAEVGRLIGGCSSGKVRAKIRRLVALTLLQCLAALREAGGLGYGNKAPRLRHGLSASSTWLSRLTPSGSMGGILGAIQGNCSRSATWLGCMARFIQCDAEIGQISYTGRAARPLLTGVAALVGAGLRPGWPKPSGLTCLSTPLTSMGNSPAWRPTTRSSGPLWGRAEVPFGDIVEIPT